MTTYKGQVNGLLSPYLEKQRILHIKKFVPQNAEILDIGCGCANVLKFIHSVNSYVGIDICEDLLLNNRKQYPQYQFFCMNIENEDLPSKQRFDVILMLAVLEHLRKPEDTIKKISYLLKNNGLLILTTPHPLAKGIHRIGAAIGIFSYKAVEEHNKFFNKKLLSQLASKSNMSLQYYRKFQFGLNQVIVLRKDN